MRPNKDEFLKMLEESKGIIFKISNSYCSEKEAQKDLVQEIIIQLWNSFDQFDGNAKRTTWVYRVALNVAISNYRKSKTRKKHVEFTSEEFVTVEVESDFDNDDDIKLLHKLIEKLDGLNKAMMLLYLDGNSYEEIANILGITSSNVGTKINRVKKKLKEQFKKENDE